MTNTYRPYPVLLMLVLAILLILMIASILPANGITAITVDMASSHGEQRHGSAAVQVRDCLTKGAMQEWVNPQTGRHARLCEISPGRYGIQIIEQEGGIWREVTAFIKDKMTSLDQVSRYLTNSGYTPLH